MNNSYSARETRAEELAGYALGASQQSPPSKRSPQIQVQLEILQKELAAQRETLERLDSQLNPVMSMAPPESKNGVIEPNEPTCPLAGELHRLGLSVSRNTALISAIARRIEV